MLVIVKKTDYHAEILDIKSKYFIIADFNKFTSQALDLKKKKIIISWWICNCWIHKQCWFE